MCPINIQAQSLIKNLLDALVYILDFLEEGDSIMADRGFDIKEGLALLGIRLNIPCTIYEKQEAAANEKELVETRLNYAVNTRRTSNGTVKELSHI